MKNFEKCHFSFPATERIWIRNKATKLNQKSTRTYDLNQFEYSTYYINDTGLLLRSLKIVRLICFEQQLWILINSAFIMLSIPFSNDSFRYRWYQRSFDYIQHINWCRFHNNTLNASRLIWNFDNCKRYLACRINFVLRSTISWHLNYARKHLWAKFSPEIQEFL